MRTAGYERPRLTPASPGLTGTTDRLMVEHTAPGGFRPAMTRVGTAASHLAQVVPHLVLPVRPVMPPLMAPIIQVMVDSLAGEHA
jgi:hypothetical protein